MNRPEAFVYLCGKKLVGKNAAGHIQEERVFCEKRIGAIIKHTVEILIDFVPLNK